MKWRHTRLKMKLIEAWLSQKELCDMIGRSPAYMSQRMVGLYPFNTNDIYSICDALKISYNDIFEYFPRIPEHKGVI